MKQRHNMSCSKQNHIKQRFVPITTLKEQNLSLLISTFLIFHCNRQSTEERSKRKAEQQKYGIFFDDEYDYMQHLRDGSDPNAVHWEYIPAANMKDKPDAVVEDSDELPPKKRVTLNLNLPSSVFASEFEEDEGLLRKAAPHSGPRPDLEPDIVAAMDDDFDHDNPDNVLEDNFMELAMGDEADDDEEDCDSDFDGSDFDEESYSEDEGGDRLAPLRGFKSGDDDAKSRFTEYSMSSSVMRRNDQLTLLDDRFEKFYENYDEPEIGALDCEEIEGHVDLSGDLLDQCMVELDRDAKEIPYDKKWDEKRIEKILEEDTSDEELVELEVEDPQKKWDCESILSTYSNAYNHPKLIEEQRKKKSKIVINPKTGVPMNVFKGENNQLTLKSIAKLNSDNL